MANLILTDRGEELLKQNGGTTLTELIVERDELKAHNEKLIAACGAARRHIAAQSPNGTSPLCRELEKAIAGEDWE